MITPEIFARIRRLFFAQHWKVGTIATELGVHPDAVRRAIEVERFVRTGPQIRRSLLDPYKGLILTTLAAPSAWPACERPTGRRRQREGKRGQPARNEGRC